jgi:DNA-binding MarR family transcriptional regulator
VSSEPGHTLHSHDEREPAPSTAEDRNGGQPPLIRQLVSEIRAFQRAVDEMDHAAWEALGVNRNDARCLDVLQEREPMTAGALAEELGLTTGAITTLLDRLERVGFVRRIRDLEDRRRVQVELTPLARERIGELYGPMGELSRESLASYGDKDIQMLTEFFRLSTKINAANAARIRGERSSD